MTTDDVRRRPSVRSTGPGPGAGVDRDPRTSAMLSARIAIVATVILGQLWGITAALDAWFEGRTAVVYWIIVFQGLSLLIALAVAVFPRRRR